MNCVGIDALVSAQSVHLSLSACACAGATTAKRQQNITMASAEPARKVRPACSCSVVFLRTAPGQSVSLALERTGDRTRKLAILCYALLRLALQCASPARSAARWQCSKVALPPCACSQHRRPEAIFMPSDWNEPLDAVCSRQAFASDYNRRLGPRMGIRLVA